MPALLTIAKKWKQLKCSSRDEWIKKKQYVHAVEYFSAIKRMNFCHCNNMDELGGYSAKLNKLDRERQILYDITCVEYKKGDKLVNITKQKFTGGSEV